MTLSKANAMRVCVFRKVNISTSASILSFIHSSKMILKGSVGSWRYLKFLLQETISFPQDSIWCTPETLFFFLLPMSPQGPCTEQHRTPRKNNENNGTTLNNMEHHGTTCNTTEQHRTTRNTKEQHRTTQNTKEQHRTPKNNTEQKGTQKYMHQLKKKEKKVKWMHCFSFCYICYMLLRWLTTQNLQNQRVTLIKMNGKNKQCTLTGHFIRYTLPVKGWTPFCLQSCLNSSWHTLSMVFCIPCL